VLAAEHRLPRGASSNVPMRRSMPSSFSAVMREIAAKRSKSPK
jgi:hypothetical protein